MITVTLILIFIFVITGRDPQPLMEKLKNVKWRDLYLGIGQKIKVYALKAGRIAAKPLLIFYYVLKDESLTTKDRMVIYGCILYVISPVTLIPQRVFRLMGVMDEATAILLVIQKVRDKVTPEVIMKAEVTLAQWFDKRESAPVK